MQLWILGVVVSKTLAVRRQDSSEPTDDCWCCEQHSTFGGPWCQQLPALDQGAELFGGMLVFDSFTIGVRAILLAFTILFVCFTMISGVPANEDGTDFYCLILGAVLGYVPNGFRQSSVDGFSRR